MLKQIPFFLLLLLMFVLAAGTVVEHYCDASTARRLIYVAPWTCVLWGVTVLTGLWHIVRRWRYIGWTVRGMHIALVLILSGAMLTHLTGKQGRVELIEGGPAIDAYEMTTTGGEDFTASHRVGHFPFRIRLLSGRTEYYPGTAEPMDYVFEMEVAEAESNETPWPVSVTMNHILGHRHWRFYPMTQTSGRAVFAVSHDLWGIGITYAGYVLLALCMTVGLLRRNDTFRMLWQSVDRRRTIIVGLFLLLLLLALYIWCPRTELLLNYLSQMRVVAIGSLTVGLLTFLSVAFRKKCLVPTFCERMCRNVLPFVAGLMSFWTISVLALRGFVGGYFPVSNGYETLLMLAALLFAAGWVLKGRHRVIGPAFALTLGGMVLLAASWSEANPAVVRLIPVLSSPFLSVHVLTIVLGYACLLAAAGLSLTVLLCEGCQRAMEKRARRVRALLCLAVYFLGIGILLGAVWANQSWGTYWSWDPKETWALITWVVYALPLHRGSLPCFSRPRFLLYYVLFGFISVLITYFGVNYFLGGLHSYA